MKHPTWPWSVAFGAGLMACPSALWAQDDHTRQLEETVRKLQERVEQLERRLGEKDKPVEPARPPSGQDDEWATPEPGQDTAGRDPEARRRLMELETWRRKFEAERAIALEEAEGQVKWDFSGKYKLRLTVRDNLNLSNPAQKGDYDTTTYFDQRFQLQTEASYGPLSAVLLLDKGNFVFDWKEDTEGTLDRWGTFETVNSALVRQLYGAYTGDVLVKVGRQNWDLGHSLVLEGPMDSVLVRSPFWETPPGRLSLSGGYMAVAGSFRDYADFRRTGPPAGDRQAVFGVQNKLDAAYLGVDLRPDKEIRIDLYGLKLFDRGGPRNGDLNLDKDFDVATLPRQGDFEPLWVGASLQGKWENWSADAEAVWVGGDYTRTQNISAYAFLGGVEYRFKDVLGCDAVAPRLDFGLGSGNKAGDDETAGTFRDFNGLFLCRDRNKFGNIFSEDLRAGYYLWDSNLANVTYLRAQVSFQPAEGFSIVPSVTRVWTTERVFEGRGPVRDWSVGTATSTDGTRDVGWEFDLSAEFSPLERLRVFSTVGYFVPGDAYDLAGGDDADGAFEFMMGSEVTF